MTAVYLTFSYSSACANPSASIEYWPIWPIVVVWVRALTHATNSFQSAAGTEEFTTSRSQARSSGATILTGRPLSTAASTSSDARIPTCALPDKRAARTAESVS
jgi:hypothetical protein